VVGTEVLQAGTLGVRENFYRGKFGSPKAKSRKRNVPLPSGVVRALFHLRSASPFSGPDDLVFPSKTGTALDEKNLMRRVVKPAAKKLGMPWLGWHVFRHTHATLADRVGMAPVDRQAQLGHE
jgi:integrase